MATADVTPAAMDVRFEGFDLGAGAAGDSANALAIAERVVAEHLGEGWEIIPNPVVRQQFDVRPRGRSLTVAEAWDRARAMRQDRDVQWVEPMLVTPNMTAEIQPGGEARGEGMVRGAGGGDLDTTPNWHITDCGIEAAWKVNPLPSGGKRFGEGIIVGHPDTGYLKHPEIWTPPNNRIRVADAFDYILNATDALVPTGGSTHGTATASVIMSAVDGPLNPGVKGVAPMAEIIPLRTDNDVIHFSWNSARRAVERAIEKGCHVISMSMGGPLSGPSFHRAIQAAVSKGIIVVAAAGNRVIFVTYPGRYDEVICVAATNQAKRPWSGSCRGEAVDLSAPGENVWRATVEDGTDVVKPSNGTSYSTAVIAGVAALWLAHHGRENLVAKYGARNIPAVFKELLVRQGVDVPSTGERWEADKYGAGIVNAQRVLEAQLPETAPSRGMASTRGAGGVEPTRFDELAHYFPDVPREVVRRNAVELLNTTDAELENVLATYGEELKLHAALNPEVQMRLSGAVNRGTTRGVGDVAVASAEGRAMMSGGLSERIGI